MACYHPIPARRSTDGGPWTLQPEIGTADSQVPCGKCLGCRTDKANDWTHRCVHEARLHAENRFITLTYDDAHNPGELKPDDVQKFLKKLRRAAQRKAAYPALISDSTRNIRYLLCGEYGEQTLRPHYHICAFNLGFADERQWNKHNNVSPTLEKIWGKGECKIQPFTPGAAGYIAGYITKTGPRTYYDDDGVVLQPPFRRASQKPAIGKTWLDQFAADVQHGYVITTDGQKARVPRYYAKKLLERHDHAARTYGDTKAKRRTWNENNDPLRRAAQEIIHARQLQEKGRKLV